MRRSSMRRGSAVLLSLLPLLGTTYALPTYMGNEAIVAHMNEAREAAPEPVVPINTVDAFAEAPPVPAHASDVSALSNIASYGRKNWLTPKRRERRQAPTSDSFSDSSSENQEAPAAAPAGRRRKGGFIENIGSYGTAFHLGTAKRDIEEREAAPEADPMVKLDFGYIPPKVNNLLGRDMEEREAAPEADARVTLDMDYVPPPVNNLAPYQPPPQ
ncbi:MAG: hypothetical protein Q9226_007571 [Calogaya cf. arnoldii]